MFEARLAAFDRDFPELGWWLRNHPDAVLTLKSPRSRGALRFQEAESLPEESYAQLVREAHERVEERLADILAEAGVGANTEPLLRSILLSSLLRVNFLERARPSGWRLFYLEEFQEEDQHEALRRLDATLARLSQHLSGGQPVSLSAELLDRFVELYQQPIWEAVCTFIDEEAERAACFLDVFRRLQQDGYAALREWDVDFGSVYLLVLVKHVCLAHLEQKRGMESPLQADALLLRMVTSSLLHACVSDMGKSLLLGRLLHESPEQVLGHSGSEGRFELAQAAAQLTADARLQYLQAGRGGKSEWK